MKSKYRPGKYYFYPESSKDKPENPNNGTYLDLTVAEAKVLCKRYNDIGFAGWVYVGEN